MRKILSKKFWSHGTPLGYMGPLFQRDVRLGAWNLQIPFIWGPVDPPGLVAPQVNAKILKSLGSWCDLRSALLISYIDHHILNYKTQELYLATTNRRTLLAAVKAYRSIKMRRYRRKNDFYPRLDKCHQWSITNIPRFLSRFCSFGVIFFSSF